MQIANTIALVTGAASGLGFSTAHTSSHSISTSNAWKSSPA